MPGIVDCAPRCCSTPAPVNIVGAAGLPGPPGPSSVTSSTPTTLAAGVLTSDGSFVGSVATVPIAEGGTGASTQAAALTALLGASVVPIANGGTGAATQAAALAAILGGAPLPVANGGTGATAAGTAAQQLGTTYRLLGVIKAADFNVTTDQPIAGFPSKWIPRRITAQNASVSLTTAAGGIYTAAGKTGTVIVAAAQVYSALTTPTKWKDLTIDATGGGPTTDVQTATTIFFALTTGQGAPATGDIYIWGEDLS
jgi:hypothetical protein